MIEKKEPQRSSRKTAPKSIKAARLRLIVVLCVFAVIAVGYFATAGIGNLCAIGWNDISLICPLGALAAMLAQKTIIPQAVISLVIAGVAIIVLGRFFCAWICPVPPLERALPGAKKRAAKALCSKDPGCASCASPCGKSKGIKLDSRHGILAGALVSTLVFGFPVFCLVCPIGLSLAAALLIMRLFVFGEITWAIIIVPAIIAVELIFLPRWCQNICPLGALTSLIAGANKTFRPIVDGDKCLKQSEGIDCNLCAKACPEGINLHDVACGRTTLNDCTKCRDCADVCPVNAISFPALSKKAKQGKAAVAKGSEE